MCAVALGGRREEAHHARYDEAARTGAAGEMRAAEAARSSFSASASASSSPSDIDEENEHGEDVSCPPHSSSHGCQSIDSFQAWISRHCQPGGIF